MSWRKRFLCLLVILAISRSLQLNDETKAHNELLTVPERAELSSVNASLAASRRLVTIAQRRAAKVLRSQITVERIVGKQCPFILKGRCEDKLNDPALAPWDLLEAGSAALNALEELCGLRIGGLGDSVAEQAYHALHCYVDTATAPAVRQNGSHKKRPPNGLNVTFPNFVHLPTVLLNQSALKDYLMGALKGMDVIVVSFGTWYDWQSSFSSSSSSSFSSEEENTLSSSLGVRPTAATTFEEVLAQAHVIDANLTARMLETHCPFTDDTQRATFKSNMYEEVWEGTLPGRARRSSVRRRAGCLHLLGPAAYASDLRRFADVVLEIRREERASGTKLLPHTFVWKDVAPQHFTHVPSGRFEWGAPANRRATTPSFMRTPHSSTELHSTNAHASKSSRLREESKQSITHDVNASQCGPVRDVKLAYERNAIADAVLQNARRLHGKASTLLPSSSPSSWVSAAVVAHTWESDLGAHQGHATDYGAHDQNAVGPDCTHYCNPSATTRGWAAAMASAIAESLTTGQTLL